MSEDFFKQILDGVLEEFNKESLKVDFVKDCTFQMNGEDISISEGESIQLQRSVIVQLKKDGIVTVHYPNMLTELKQALSKEKMIGEFEISSVDKFFFLQLREYLDEIESKNIREQYLALMQEFIRMRNGKLIKYASTTLSTIEHISSKLSFEELYYLKLLLDISEQLKEAIFPKDLYQK